MGTNRKLYEQLNDLTGREVAVASNPDDSRAAGVLKEMLSRDAHFDTAQAAPEQVFAKALYKTPLRSSSATKRGSSR